jgi:hypothetical protein
MASPLSPTTILVKSPAVTGAPISGRHLAHNHHDQIGRAFMAADLFTGATRLVKPTITQVAVLARINRTYAHWAIRRLSQRNAIELGWLPLVPPAEQANGSTLAPTSIPDNSELMHIARVVGKERMLEAAIALEATE